MTAKPTPGPWHLSTDGEIGDPPRTTAIRVITPRSDFPGWVGAHIEPTMSHPSGDLFTPEDEANARLIAAAPELLEALRGLRDVSGVDHLSCPFEYEGVVCGHCNICKARAAIAKAEGRE